MLVMLLIVLLLTLFLFLIFKRRQHMSSLKKFGIYGPKPNLIFGNLLDIARDGYIRTFPKWTKKYGPIVGFYIGGLPQVLITDFELIRRVMIKDFHIFSNRNEVIPGAVHPQPQLQNMIMWKKGNEWRQLRASMTPSFSSSKLNAMEPLMLSSIENNLLNELDDKSKSGQELNMTLIAPELTFSTVAKCIFGLDLSLNQISKEAQHFIDVTHPRLDKSILAKTMLLFPSLRCIAHPLRVWWETLRLKMLWSPEGVCYDIIKKIVKYRRDTNTKMKDFLQLLMDTKKIRSTAEMNLEMSSEDVASSNQMSSNVTSENLSEEEILSNAMIFLLAASETTSVSLQFVIYNLVKYQDVQERLRNELKQAIDGSDEKVNFLKRVSNVPLLNNVIKETLRMYPPASHFTTRVAAEDYEYQGFLIPKGTGVFIGANSIHNDPTLWPEPEKFRPDRFENEIDKLAYLPFGGGPRNCIGMRFAYMELQLALASMVLRYRFEPGPSTEEDLQLSEFFATLMPTNGVFCKVVSV